MRCLTSIGENRKIDQDKDDPEAEETKEGEGEDSPSVDQESNSECDREDEEGDADHEASQESKAEEERHRATHSTEEGVASRPTEWLTTMELWPETGRRHQLRLHMNGLGHSIVGDKLYSNNIHVHSSPKGAPVQNDANPRSLVLH